MDILGAGALDQYAAATVGRWRRAKPVHVSTPGITIITHRRRHPNPTHAHAHHHQPPPTTTGRAGRQDKMERIRQRREYRVHMSPLEQKTPKNLYKLSKLFYIKYKKLSPHHPFYHLQHWKSIWVRKVKVKVIIIELFVSFVMRMIWCQHAWVLWVENRFSQEMNRVALLESTGG